VILEALVRHYDRLNASGDVAAFGYSRQQCSFSLVIDAEGELQQIRRLIDDSSGRPRPQSLIVPGQSKPSGQGINPCFLWDNAGYMLGFAPGDAEQKTRDRAALTVAAFRDRHVSVKDEIDDPGFTAVCRFLESWDAGQLVGRDDTDPFDKPGFGVFEIKGENGFVHERGAVRRWYEQQLAATPGTASDTSEGLCLVTGQHSPIARLHEPKIKGVSGGQSSGTTLVSFNESAYGSHGKTQGENAPVSEEAAFKYATALNRLLADSHHRAGLGETTCVFWTDRPETEADDAFADLLGGLVSAEGKADASEAGVASALQDFLSRFRQGKQAGAAPDGAEAPFYILGLAPNAARLSIRFWHVCTVAELAARLAAHVAAVRIYDAYRKQDVHPTLRELLRETGREAKDIPPQLAGDLARAIVLGRALPDTFAVALLRRMKAEQSDGKRNPLSSTRAAGLKAWLNRNHQKEVPVALDPERPDPAYRLGRLFAAYERVQSDAAGSTKLNRSIRDSYLSSASATPAGIFPRLYRLNQHHLNKLRRDKTGLAVIREKLIGEICGGLDDFPRHLSVQNQGLFALGYYHQTQDFFTKRETADPEAAATKD